MSYQSHGDESGVSDSHTKLQRLFLPERLDGQRFLDIGCNEGFFCNAAAERGASVLGIDSDPRAIEFAKAHYSRPGVEFHVGSWSLIPPGSFDVILWASAMHYEIDPASIIRQIKEALSPTGLFILECGVVWDIHKEYVPVRRPTDVCWYPTQRFLFEELLQGFSVRSVSPSAVTQWDTVPRSVFHCRKIVPTVLLIRGASGRGKSTLAAHFSPVANKTVSTDRFIERIVFGDEPIQNTSPIPYDRLRAVLQQSYNKDDLASTYEQIDEKGLTTVYVDLLALTISSLDEVIVVDGYITDIQATALTQRLSWQAIVWDVKRRAYQE